MSLSVKRGLPPELCWGDEWPTLSPGACLREAASAKAGERACPVE
jgi:hypothetical protein